MTSVMASKGSPMPVAGDSMSSVAQWGPIFADVWLVQASATVVGEEEISVVSFLAKARLTDAARAPRAVDPAAVLDMPRFVPAVGSTAPAIVPGGSS